MAELPSGPQPLPIEVVRDLLGICRAGYAMEMQRGNKAVAARLRKAGEDLRRALALAVRDGSASAHERAWQLASSAASVIGYEVMREHNTLHRAVEVTAKRMQAHKHGSDRDRRDVQRAARIKRG